MEQILSNQGKITGIEGVAGAGKTTSLTAIRNAAEREYYQECGLELHYREAGDGLEVGHVERHDIEAQMQSGSSDDQVREVDADSLAHLLAVDAPGQLRHFQRERMHGYSLKEFFYEIPAFAVGACLSSIDTVASVPRQSQSRAQRQSFHTWLRHAPGPRTLYPCASRLRSGYWSRGLLPCGWIPQSAAFDDLFQVSGEVRVHAWLVAQLCGVLLRQSDGFGEQARRS